jgi:omega-amidase
MAGDAQDWDARQSGALMKIAVAQMACTLGNVPANVEAIRAFCRRASETGADLIVFPEMADTGYSMGVIRKHASRWSEGAVPELQRMARTFSLAIVCGVSEREDNCIYNSQIVVDAAANIAAKYRKTHLFAPIEEDKCFAAGDRLVSLDFADFRVGLSICYDLRFPEVYRQLAVKENANVFIISAAWPFPRVEHFRALAVARAIENQSYVIAANRVGTDNGVTFCGSSMIIDPAGNLLAAASRDREELIDAEISLPALETVRSQMRVFDHRRADLY